MIAMSVGLSFYVGNLECCQSDNYVSGLPSMLESLSAVK